MVLESENTMLTIEQQQVGIVVLIIVVAAVVLLSLAGALVWYLVFTRGFAPLALFLLLPVLWATAVLAPFIWLIGASIDHFLAAHEATDHVSGHRPAGAQTGMDAGIRDTVSADTVPGLAKVLPPQPAAPPANAPVASA